MPGLTGLKEGLDKFNREYGKGVPWWLNIILFVASASPELRLAIELAWAIWELLPWSQRTRAGIDLAGACAAAGKCKNAKPIDEWRTRWRKSDDGSGFMKK